MLWYKWKPLVKYQWPSAMPSRKKIIIKLMTSSFVIPLSSFGIVSSLLTLISSYITRLSSLDYIKVNECTLAWILALSSSKICCLFSSEVIWAWVSGYLFSRLNFTRTIADWVSTFSTPITSCCMHLISIKNFSWMAEGLRKYASNSGFGNYFLLNTILTFSRL